MRFILALLLLSGPAFAETQDPAMLQAAIAAIQSQRNQALDQAAGLAAQLQLVSKELADMKAAGAKVTAPGDKQ